MRGNIGPLRAVLLVALTVVAGCGRNASDVSLSSTVESSKLPSYRIDGAVASSGGKGLQDVTMTLSGVGSATATAITDVSGIFTLANLANGNYTVTPSKSGYTFSPTSSLQTVNSEDIANINFTATLNASIFGLWRTDAATNNNNGNILIAFTIDGHYLMHNISGICSESGTYSITGLNISFTVTDDNCINYGFTDGAPGVVTQATGTFAVIDKVLSMTINNVTHTSTRQ